MSRPVFISYARGASAADAQALANALKDLAFFDTDVIDDGDLSPQRLLDAMPAVVADESWPAAAERERLNTLVRQRLSIVRIPIRDRLAGDEAQKLVAAFLDESKVPKPHSLQGIVCSLPPGVAEQSIARFGRANDLRHTHRILLEAPAVLHSSHAEFRQAAVSARHVWRLSTCTGIAPIIQAEFSG